MSMGGTVWTEYAGVSGEKSKDGDTEDCEKTKGTGAPGRVWGLGEGVRCAGEIQTNRRLEGQQQRSPCPGAGVCGLAAWPEPGGDGEL